MKFAHKLSEATLLKRHHRFLIEATVNPRKKRMLFCPNLGLLKGCDVLGSRIWYSKANLILDGTLDIWEIVEVDGGWLTCINEGHVRTIIREALEQNQISQLQGFQLLQPAVLPIEQDIELLWHQEAEQCFIRFESVFFGDENLTGSFPQEPGQGKKALEDLIAIRKMGHRAVLFFCVQHSGVTCVDVVDPHYRGLLEQAVREGVEVLAYRTHVQLTGLSLGEQIPVMDLNQSFKDSFSGI